MRWLAIDTSGGSTVGVVEVPDGAAAVELSRAVSPDPRGHVEALAPMIKACLEEAGIEARHLEGIVVGTGPAPFTGLRVGISTAAALGRAVGCEVRGVSSLDAIAWHSSAQVVVTTDARRREVYWAAYAEGLGPADPGWRLHGPEVGPPSGVLEWVAAHRGDVIGPALAVHPELAEAEVADPEAESAVTPVALVEVAEAFLRVGAPTPLTPLYLRRPDVHVAGARKRAT
ncbi:tRNA (adenosine(37)-N6)-threonylcarbamoyltransferase complex dimerization subunit type 1 TsaB [Actinotalea caeni]|uniref:tRNA (adenosine(37)-N6)-threonylcarbamoyltransferase complex dimerization subunit type 1 TsaB n=1 Tax=Actinotalea caeni TaxID=1348467 RepID=UPI0012E15B4F|nr:tRNA (adenosine(37)-N6)-threonylcarbamoyltransferase complex dimerization subunit type 1 TsaB [Actinotalea caeni]